MGKVRGMQHAEEVGPTRRLPRMHPEEQLAIVVVNFGSHQFIEQYLGEIDLAAVPAAVVVVDNFHSGAERAAVAELVQRNEYDLVPLSRNIGFGGGANIGVRRAADKGHGTFLLLNPDARLDAPTARALLHASREQPLALISPRIDRPDGRRWFCGGALDMSTGDLRAGWPRDESCRWLTGAALVSSTELWRRLGGFDETYFLYWEDVDLSFRVRSAGGELVLRSDLVAQHQVGGSQDSQQKSTLYYFYNCRNRLVFAARNLDRRTRSRWLCATPRSSWRILLRGGRRQVLARPSTLGAAVAGSFAGVWHVLRHWRAQRG